MLAASRGGRWSSRASCPRPDLAHAVARRSLGTLRRRPAPPQSPTCPGPWHHQSAGRPTPSQPGYYYYYCYYYYYYYTTDANAHASTHARTHACTHAHTHAHTHARTHTRTHTRAHARARAHTRTHIRAYTRIHTRTHTHTGKQKRTRTHTHTCTQTHAHKRTHAPTGSGLRRLWARPARTGGCSSSRLRRPLHCSPRLGCFRGSLLQRALAQLVVPPVEHLQLGDTLLCLLLSLLLVRELGAQASLLDVVNRSRL